MRPYTVYKHFALTYYSTPTLNTPLLLLSGPIIRTLVKKLFLLLFPLAHCLTGLCSSNIAASSSSTHEMLYLHTERFHMNPHFNPPIPPPTFILLWRYIVTSPVNPLLLPQRLYIYANGPIRTNMHWLALGWWLAGHLTVVWWVFHSFVCSFVCLRWYSTQLAGRMADTMTCYRLAGTSNDFILANWRTKHLVSVKGKQASKTKNRRQTQLNCIE